VHDVVDQNRTDLFAIGVDREGPHHGLGGADGTHLGKQAPQDAAIGAEGDEVELHALERDVGFVFDDEVQPAAVVSAFDAVELDADLFVRGECAERQQNRQDRQRTE
jgi:hypothetical protein